MRQDTMSSGSGVKYTLPANLDLKYHTKKVFHLLSLNKQNFFRTCLQLRWISQTARSVRHMIDTFLHDIMPSFGLWERFHLFPFSDRHKKTKYVWMVTSYMLKHSKGPVEKVWSAYLVWYLPGLQLYHHFYGVENNKLWRFTVQNLE